MTRIIDAAIDRSRTVIFLLIVTIIAGTITYVQIPKEANPDIQVPFAYVSIPYQGISPEDGERLIVKPMEVELRGLEGLEEITGIASLGYAAVLLEFDVNVDMDQAMIDVREKVDLARAEIPQESDEPVVREFNQSLFPTLIVTLSGDVPERTLYALARDAQDEIEALSSVLSANLVGDREELLEVLVDPAKLEAFNITGDELVRAVAQNNRLVPAGALKLDNGSFNVKVPGLFETREDVLSLPIKASGDGVVKLSDVAEIRRTFKDRTGYARVDGQPTIAIEVVKRLGENIIETNLAVREVMAQESASWPEAVEVKYLLDQSKWIYQSLDSLQASILTAIILVMIVVVAALGLRSAGLVGFAIPASFVTGFLLLGVMGFTVNMMVMFGMVLSVGILVDGAIVVVEYADRKMAEGLHRVDAFREAGKRMFWPIVSSTGTTLAAFFPMIFWPGMSGKFMSYLPYTLIFVLCASLMMALIFLPVLGSVFGGKKAVRKASDPLAQLGDDDPVDPDTLPGITGVYTRLIARLIRHPLLVISGAGVILVTIFMLFSANQNGVEFFVETQPEQAKVQVSARGNLSPSDSFRIVNEVEAILLGMDHIETVFNSTGSADLNTEDSGNSPADMIGEVLIELTDWRTRPTSTEVFNQVREATKHLSGIRIEVRELEQGPPVGKDIQFELRSTDTAALDQATRQVRAHFDTVDGLIEIEDTLPLPGIEWQLKVDREQAGRFGADVTTIGTFVQMVTDGLLVGTYRPDDAEDEIDIRIRLPEDNRTIQRLDQLRIQTTNGPVPIGNFVSRTPQPQVDSITRVDAKNVRRVRANVAEGILANDKVIELEEWIDQADLPENVSVAFRGANEEQADAAAFLVVAMFASLFLMSIILLTQFNNFYHAGLILSSVLLSVFGVLIGMMVMDQAFSVIMTGTGVVALAGIVVNNNIVLIDTFQYLRRQGIALDEAVVRTAAQRFRPVLLTTITTICGLMPMVLELTIDFVNRDINIGGPNAVWWSPLATAVVFGLSFSTLLTLVLTPVMLALPGRIDAAFHRLNEMRKSILGREPEAAASGLQFERSSMSGLPSTQVPREPERD
ncbi:MAG: efflux RND transporter permease subunit [Pseudomonadota bacterium]